MDSKRQQALIELYRRDALNPQQKAAVEELSKRGVLTLPGAEPTADQMIKDEGQAQALKELAEKQSMLDTFLISAGKGITDIGRGVGLVDEPSAIESQAFNALSEEMPITSGAGEIVGQAAPFLLPGSAVGAIGSTGARVAASTGLGALEGGIVSSGTGGESEDVAKSAGIGGVIAGAVEAVSPMLGRVVRKAYSRLMDKTPSAGVARLVDENGQPSQELLSALKEEGISWDDTPLEFRDMIAQNATGTDPKEAARLASFKAVGAEPTKGQLTRDFDQLKREQQLLVSGAEGAGDEFRDFQLKQSQAITQHLDDLVQGQGLSPSLGADIKDALTGRRSTLKSARKEAYKKLAEQADEIGEAALSPDAIISAMPDARTLRSLQRAAPEKFAAVMDELAEFGLSKANPEELAKKGIEPEMLSLSNFEEFRKALRRISQSDQTGTIDNLIIPIKQALDEEVEMAAEQFARGSGNIAEVAKEARRSNVALKTEFDEKKITSKLIDAVSRGSTQPKVEASQVYSRLMANSAPIENLGRVIKSLKSSGARGQQAIGGMRAQAVMDLMDSAFRAGSRQVKGERVFGATPFVNQFKKLEPKLELLFKDSPEEFKRLKNAVKVAQDLIPPEGAVPRGSAGVILDIAKKTGLYSIMTKVPGADILLGMADSMAKKGKDEAALMKAINAKPQVKALAGQIDRELPALASALGIAGISTTGEQEDE